MITDGGKYDENLYECLTVSYKIPWNWTANFFLKNTTTYADNILDYPSVHQSIHPSIFYVINVLFLPFLRGLEPIPANKVAAEFILEMSPVHHRAV